MKEGKHSGAEVTKENLLYLFYECQHINNQDLAVVKTDLEEGESMHVPSYRETEKEGQER